MAGEIDTILLVAGVLLALLCILYLLNKLSYSLMKNRILKRERWDLNICCGKTDGGGVNADIVRHSDLPRFVQVEDVYRLPFQDNQFENVLCSHTIEHVEDPDRFYAELRRIGKKVTLVLPPLWDISAALNLLEHRHIFITLRKEHDRLPKHVPMPFARFFNRVFGQRIHA